MSRTFQTAFFLILFAFFACKEETVPPVFTPKPFNPEPLDCANPRFFEEKVTCLDSLTDRQITVMTFNILVGGGLDTSSYEFIHRDWAFLRKSRIENICKLVDIIQPDILAIQEAWGWNDGDDPYVDIFAKKFGYNYWLPEDEDGFLSSGLILFTKYEIVEAEEKLKELPGGGLQAIVRLPWGERLHIFETHKSVEGDTRVPEAEAILASMAQYIDSSSLILGDMNYGSDAKNKVCSDPNFTNSDDCIQRQQFLDGKWILVSSTCDGVDHIWTSPKVAELSYPIYQDCIEGGWNMPSGKISSQIDAPEEIQKLYNDISDHYPSIARIGFNL